MSSFAPEVLVSSLHTTAHSTPKKVRFMTQKLGDTDTPRQCFEMSSTCHEAGFAPAPKLARFLRTEVCRTEPTQSLFDREALNAESSVFATHGPGSTMDFLEIFAGHAGLTTEIGRTMKTLQPFDTLYGVNILRPEDFAELESTIRAHRPALIWLAPPCTVGVLSKICHFTSPKLSNGSLPKDGWVRGSCVELPR